MTTDENDINPDNPDAAPEPVRAVFALGLMDTLTDTQLAEQVIDHSEAPVERALAWRLLRATQTVARLQHDADKSDAIEDDRRANT